MVVAVLVVEAAVEWVGLVSIVFAHDIVTDVPDLWKFADLLKLPRRES